MLEEMKGRDLWEEILKLRDEQREHQKKAVWLIKGKDLPWESNKQGIMRWYMHPLLKTLCINTMKLFVQEIPPGSRSGRLHHPGNQVMYVLEGRGYTVLDGQKHHWAKNDVVQLPLRVKGVTVQHFNSDPDQPARVGCAERMLADLERTARLTGRSFRRRARPRAAKKKRGSAST